MKSPFARLFALTFMVAMFSSLNGEEEEAPALFVDSISIQVMSDLTLPGGDDPLTIAQQKFFSVPFSEEHLSLRISEMDYFLPDDHVSTFILNASLLDWNVALPLAETTYAEGFTEPSAEED